MKPMSNMRSASSMTRISTSPERDRSLLLVVEQAARRPDQHVGHRLDRVALERGSPCRRRPRASSSPVWPPEDLGVRRDLRHELARRRDDQRARRRAAGRRRLLQEPREDRDEERRGLAGPGLRLARDVAAGEREREPFAWTASRAKPASAMPCLHVLGEG